MNSTLKSLLFWMVLVVVGVLIWNFSTTLRSAPAQMTFTDFLEYVERSQVSEVEITGNDIVGKLKADVGDGKREFRTYVPTQYQGLGNKLA